MVWLATARGPCASASHIIPVWGPHGWTTLIKQTNTKGERFPSSQVRRTLYLPAGVIPQGDDVPGDGADETPKNLTCLRESPLIVTYFRAHVLVTTARMRHVRFASIFPPFSRHS